MPPIRGHWRRLQFHAAASAPVGIVLAVLVRFVGEVPWPAAMVFALPLAVFAAPLSLSANYLCRALPLSRTPSVRLAVAGGGSALVGGAWWAAAGYGWWLVLGKAGWALPGTPTPALAAVVFALGALAYALSLVLHYLLQVFEDSAEAERRLLASEVAHRDAELRALRAQVDPHFLFNSLNAIAGLTTADPARARDMCQSLADFLRESLAVGASSRIPLDREVALAEQYLHVERVRFGARLVVRTSVSAESAGLMVPPLILQPLVENAVRHGIATCLDGGTIEIDARCVGDRAVIDVRNPRDGDGRPRAGTGFGLDIVRRRLRATFGDRAAVVVEPSAAAYRVSVTLPVERTAA